MSHQGSDWTVSPDNSDRKEGSTDRQGNYDTEEMDGAIKWMY